MNQKSISNSSFVIVGIVRNCEYKIADEIKRINSAFSSAKKINWIIIESDSEDKTIYQIENLKKKYSIKLISFGNLRFKMIKRTERISFCRNAYLNELNNNNQYQDTDYFVVADLDGINSNLNSYYVDYCWDLGLEWDACFPNQLAPYYDIWALRHEIWCPNDVWTQFYYLKKFSKNNLFLKNSIIYSKMITIPLNTSPIEVDSAFGGIGIYKIECSKVGKYSGLNKDGSQVCEHVSFHSSLKRKGKKLFIIPGFINGSWNEHNKEKKLWNKFKSSLILFILVLIKPLLSKKSIKNFLVNR